MDLNGNGITVSNAVWEEMKKHIPKDADGKPVHPIKADALKPVVDKYKADGKPFNMGMVFPVSTHNYELRYWLAAGGIHPGYYSPTDITGQIKADVLISVTPPPQMPATLEAGTIHGYCVGEPWNQQAVFKGIGVPVITDYEIWKNNPGEGVRRHRGLGRKESEHHAGRDQGADPRRQVARREQQRQPHEGRARSSPSPNTSAPTREVIANRMTGTFEYEKGDKRAVPDFNVFFRYYATYPYYSDAIWYLTQMRRWGQIAEAKPDAWYAETAKKVYRPDIYLKAAKLLVDEGKAKKEDFPWDSDGYARRPASSSTASPTTAASRTPTSTASRSA